MSVNIRKIGSEKGKEAKEEAEREREREKEGRRDVMQKACVLFMITSRGFMYRTRASD